MEELKLRAWLTEDKVMLPVESVTFHRGCMDVVMPPNKRVTKVKQTIIAMQWTGLKDIHGKDIYESDIVKFFDNADDVYVATVVWNKEYACFGITFDRSYPLSFDYVEEFYTELKDIEVIGNIYEGLEYGG